MPSASQDLDLLQNEPKALEDELGLVSGRQYLVSNTGDTLILARSDANEPAAGARGHPVKPFDDIIALADANFKSWFWSADPDGGQLIITEIPR